MHMPFMRLFHVNRRGPGAAPQVQEVRRRNTLGGLWEEGVPRVLSCLSVTEEVLLAFCLFPKTTQVYSTLTRCWQGGERGTDSSGLW